LSDTPSGGRKLRILQVMRAPVGGLFRHVADLTNELASRGHHIGLAVDSLASDSETERKLRALSPSLALGIHRFAMPRVLGPGDLTVPFKLRALVRKLGVEVVHGHGAKGGFHARLAVPRRSNAATFYTPHGGVLHFDSKSPFGRAFHLLERMLMGRTDVLFFESAYARQAYASVIGEPTCPWAVVHNGLREDEFVPVSPGADAADFVFVGELRRLKGFHVLLEALAGVTRPDGSPASLFAVGDGPDRQDFEAQARALGLGDRVTFAGAGPARAAFRRGRCAVVPSLAESLPYIVMEAAAAGLPVIATNVGGIPEIFGPTRDSLVPADDAAALHQALQAFVDLPSSAAAGAQARLDFIRERFAATGMADAIEAQYLSAGAAA
jgi:glycosyltransferase involved in cell wall biosynthesis